MADEKKKGIPSIPSWLLNWHPNLFDILIILWFILKWRFVGSKPSAAQIKEQKEKSYSDLVADIMLEIDPAIPLETNNIDVIITTSSSLFDLDAGNMGLRHMVFPTDVDMKMAAIYERYGISDVAVGALRVVGLGNYVELYTKTAKKNSGIMKRF